MVRHGDLAANLNTCRQILGVDRESVGISWLPLFHDLGLIAGVLLSLSQGYPTYLMAPTTFIRNPISWLTAFSRFRGTQSCAPNFAYDACVDATISTDTSELDLTSWQVALNGAEPLHADTIARFCKQFAPNGFRAQAMEPAYGLAEATLVVSGSDGSQYPVELIVDESELRIGGVRIREDGPGTKRLTGSRRPAPGFDVRIVRPDVRRVAEPHTLGEIWVRSNSVKQGYWHKPVQTAETFGGYLATGEGPYLRTGDLGFLHDGELFVIGRLKDMIVIRGVNYYPNDIEHTVERSRPALQPAGAAVVGVDVSSQVNLVALQEIRRDHVESAAWDEIVDAIRRAVARDHQLALQRFVLLRPGGLPKTSSGKVQRAKCRAELDGSALPVLYDWQARTLGSAPFHFDTESLSQPGALERQLVDWLQRELSLTNLTWQTPLTELGIDTGQQGHSSGDACTAEQIAALDEREVAEVLRRRIADVLDGGRL
jgi:acyl-CoA synthetase (AMP-forming)/AMP-acid ligase II